MDDAIFRLNVFGVDFRVVDEEVLAVKADGDFFTIKHCGFCQCDHNASGNFSSNDVVGKNVTEGRLILEKRVKCRGWDFSECLICWRKNRKVLGINRLAMLVPVIAGLRS